MSSLRLRFLCDFKDVSTCCVSRHAISLQSDAGLESGEEPPAGVMESGRLYLLPCPPPTACLALQRSLWASPESSRAAARVVLPFTFRLKQDYNTGRSAPGPICSPRPPWDRVHLWWPGVILTHGPQLSCAICALPGVHLMTLCSSTKARKAPLTRPVSGG